MSKKRDFLSKNKQTSKKTKQNKQKTNKTKTKKQKQNKTKRIKNKQTNKQILFISDLLILFISD